MSHLRKSLLGRNVRRSGFGVENQDFSPTKWNEYFDSEETVYTENGAFNIFQKGNNTGPVIICLHGGGYSGLTWALFAVEITNAINCQVIAIDLRGHGNTKTKDDSDLSLSTLAKDVIEVLKILYQEERPPVILVGHSMGGAVAVECSYLLDSTVGLCVIDVVEGTALESLSSMQSLLRGRPSQFTSINHAIQWCYKGGQTHNLEAAKVSMPGQVINISTGNLAANECDSVEECPIEASFVKPFPKSVSPIKPIPEASEEGTSGTDNEKLAKTESTDPSTHKDTPKYKWRIDLSKTEPFWSGWFKGLSQKFLNIRIPKLLLLANIHGLDTTLTVGQMQGKFQLQVLSKSGHAIHEDQPQHVAEIIGGYLVKQKLATARVDIVVPMPGC